VIHWHTDGSVNDWGWRLYVTSPAMSTMLVVSNPTQLQTQLNELHQYLCEAPAPQSMPTNLKDFKVDPAGPAAGTTSFPSLDELPSLASIEAEYFRKAFPKPQSQTMVCFGPASMHKEPHADSAAIGVVCTGSEVTVSMVKEPWLFVNVVKVKSNDPSALPSGSVGWVKKHEDGKRLFGPRSKQRTEKFRMDPRPSKAVVETLSDRYKKEMNEAHDALQSNSPDDELLSPGTALTGFSAASQVPRCVSVCVCVRQVEHRGVAVLCGYRALERAVGVRGDARPAQVLASVHSLLRVLLWHDQQLPRIRRSLH
jgi:hypothetical protein